MPTGLLTAAATLDIAQFWPEGSADADTTTLLVDIQPNGFCFQPHPDLPPRPTTAFFGAKVHGKYGSRSVIDARNRIKVRLQGIDAPELHYRPALPTKKAAPQITDAQRKKFTDFNEDFLQAFAESATTALSRRLAGFGVPRPGVRVASRVDLPNEAFDVYGRLVGDVIVTEANAGLNINHWLLENGWVFPAYYNSMDADEILELNRLWETGYRTGGRPWLDGFQYAIPAFDPQMRYRKKGPIRDDSGPLTLPKIFRRQALWWARTQAGIDQATLPAFIAAGGDKVHLTEEYLADGVTASPVYKLGDFIDQDGTVQFDPEFLVFREDPSTLKDAQGDPVAGW